MNKILVSGTTAYDNILITNTNLKEHLIEKDLGKINISYVASDLKKENGGTGANIAYNLALLGETPILLSSIGIDYEFNNFFKENIDLSYINKTDGFTARSYITKDGYNNQISGYYPGAMNNICEINSLDTQNIKYSIIAPNNILAMKKHINIFKNLGVKTLFDPGQQITQMTKEELEYCFKYSDYIIINEYEYEILKKQVEKNDGEMIELFEKMIITYGLKGSKIFDRNYNIIEIEGVENPNFLDSTGAGDAFRAGLLYGLNNSYNWQTAGRIGALLASISTQKYGAQNHKITQEKIKELYNKTFNCSYEKNI